MNYKVMQRPMFKLGGKVASQGTGITSGLDTKANYSIGGLSLIHISEPTRPY